MLPGWTLGPKSVPIGIRREAGFSLGFRIWDLGFGIWDLGFGISALGSRL